MPQTQLRVGVIGTGGMGERHVNNLTHEVAAAQVIALMDVDETRLQEVAQQCGAIHTFSDGHDLINHPDVDTVLIAAPDSFHAELTHACIKAGKPVLCEKPLATTAAEAYTIIEAELDYANRASGQRLVQLGFMREYDPAHQKVKTVCDSGKLGEILSFHGSHIHTEMRRPRTVEDVISNSAIHDIHSARWLVGSEIETVFASYRPSAGQPDSARLVLIQLQFANGALGHIECNAQVEYGYEVDVKLTGEFGSVQTNSLQSAIVSHNNSRGQWVEDDWLQRFDTAYIHEARDWVQSIQNNRPSGPSAWDGYISMIISDACIESAKTGQPIKIDIPKTPAIYKR